MKYNDLKERFLKYISIDTTSDSSKYDTPSTYGQLELANVIYNELLELKVETYFDKDKCYLYAKIKGNPDLPKVGFVSHFDTSQTVSGKNIKYKIIENYNGKDIILNEKTILSTSEYKELNDHIGKTIITTSGDTLLGADDKAGLAEIMEMINHFSEENNNGDIFVCFTPDEEIGLGTENLDYSKFCPDYAYTVDGNKLGEISYENFNAATAKIKINGINTHAGYAKDKMINASRIATLISNLLPEEYPENTSGYEGFFHLTELSGNVSLCKMKYLIRDFDNKNFNNRIETLELIIKELNFKFNNCIELEICKSYSNMHEIISKNKEVVDIALDVIKNLNIGSYILPIRGGTDGVTISFNGIPCPNIGTGGYNFHSIYEYAVLEDMEKTVDILISIVDSFSNYKINKDGKTLILK